MEASLDEIRSLIHCRIGSSEMSLPHFRSRIYIHCRIGSSERQEIAEFAVKLIHCRIGSSETFPSTVIAVASDSLPDRQLRN